MARLKVLFGLIVIVSAVFLSVANVITASPSPNVTPPPPSISASPHPAGTPTGGAAGDAQAGSWSARLGLLSLIISAVATGFIAWFNCQLVGVTKEMEGATRDAAKAATQSAQAAEAALHADRPFLLVTAIKVDTFGLGKFGEKNLHIAVVVRNFGNGPADITDYIAETELFDPPTHGRSDPPVWHGPNDGQRINDSLIAPHETVEDRLLTSLSMSREEYASAFSDDKRVGVYGRIRYRGASNQIYETRFFWWYFANGDNSARALTKELNDHT
jgi:hypothetical protein